MMKVFEIRSPQGVLRQEFYSGVKEKLVTPMLEQFVNNEEWYQINYHECYNDEGKPCEPWETVAQKGELPQGE
ncbi:hypothetical protein [Bacillus sp. OK048]|uniref:hypothetical protein n=1 Tax=Bacillus sp. OK048 TaxID=1882761 RepID=UPI00088E701F|nr:hypothetical protein [Bacillus sp. OK048]SDM23097.1 hypothetical protein SAMN05443253_102387 [Bacillus sp. OK048]